MFSNLLGSSDQELIDNDNHNNRQSNNQAIVKRRAWNLRQRIAEHAEDQRAQYRACNRPAAARQARENQWQQVIK